MNFIKPVKPFPDQSYVCLDIETAGLDPKNDRIYLIGLKSKKSSNCITDPDEAVMIKKLFAVIDAITKTHSIMLIGHNIMVFDLPFIMMRAMKHKIPCPFKYRTIRGTRLDRVFCAGGYRTIYYTDIEAKNIDIIDTLFLTMLWDAQNAELSDHTLKTAAVELGCRAERRLELDHYQIKNYWASNDLEKLKEYLQYDLEDTEFLYNRLMPPYYYMQSVVPVKPQEMVLKSTAKKLEKILQAYYKEKSVEKFWKPPEADPVQKYQGAMTGARPGLYRHVHKIDVSSLYPSIILQYGIRSHKDTDAVMPRVLKFLMEERLRYKSLGKTDRTAKEMSEAYKILINSFYGHLGSNNPYNDMTAAAKVTAYGRKILKLMLEELEKRHERAISWDTDGVIFEADDGVATCKAVQAVLPRGINIDLEFTADWCYVNAPKNYIVYYNDEKIKYKGVYKKRNLLPLLKEYTRELCKAWMISEDAAEQYHQKICNTIIDGQMNIDLLACKRKIAKSEKETLKYGVPGDVIRVYIGVGSCGKSVKVIEGPYHAMYYLKMIKDMYDEIVRNIADGQGTQIPIAKLFQDAETDPVDVQTIMQSLEAA